MRPKESERVKATEDAPASGLHFDRFGRLCESAMLPHMDQRSISDVGGTSGGLGLFLLGFAMACIGGFLISWKLMT